MAFLPCVMASVGCRWSSSITKSAAHISQEWFDMVTKFYTDIAPSHSTAITAGYDVNSWFRSDATSSVKKWRKCHHRRLLVKFLQNGFSENHISHTSRGQSVSQTCRIWRRWLLSASCKMQLNTSISTAHFNKNYQCNTALVILKRLTRLKSKKCHRCCYRACVKTCSVGKWNCSTDWLATAKASRSFVEIIQVELMYMT